MSVRAMLAVMLGAWPVSAGSPGGPTRVDLEAGHCLVAMPAGLAERDRAPLIVALHGTETKAADILAFWRSLETPLPVVIVAPQGVAAGWRDGDLPLIREVVSALLPTLPVDMDRVLLTGHSAGGAMTFHLLYKEGFPCGAAAVTANYLPPGITGSDVAKRTAVPVFYAVGERDINRPRMRDGLDLLRANGVAVTVSRPPIGHRLDREVGQAAMDWWMGICRSGVDERIRAGAEARSRGGVVGEALHGLEAVLANRGTHFADQVARAQSLADQLRAAGRARIEEARAKLEAGDALGAHKLLRAVESDYRTSSLQNEARKLRERVETDESVRAAIRAEADALAKRESERLWTSVRDAMSAGDKDAARTHCQTLVSLYPETPRGREARALLDLFRIVDGGP